MKENLFNNNSVGTQPVILKKEAPKTFINVKDLAEIPKFIPEQSYLVFRCIFSK